ncbi:FxsA family protein [Rhodovulum sp. DZ06]|uniref:FxsA family protein n=1 Tax=Rhodovulum sp. DZ06 TaxID=3425126 RepID=UPI003D3261F6
MPLFLLLVIVPIIEIALFIEVGGALGLWPTIGIVILTAVIGTAMLRGQGAWAMQDLQRSLSGQGDPGKALAHGAMILVSGVLLLTPGFFTDAVGFALLLPPVRLWLMKTVGKRVQMQGSVHMQGFGGGFGPGPRPEGRATRPPEGPHNPAHDQGADIQDAEWEEVPPPPGSKPSGWTRPPE